MRIVLILFKINILISNFSKYSSPTLYLWSLLSSKVQKLGLVKQHKIIMVAAATSDTTSTWAPSSRSCKRRSNKSLKARVVFDIRKWSIVNTQPWHKEFAMEAQSLRRIPTRQAIMPISANNLIHWHSEKISSTFPKCTRHIHCHSRRECQHRWIWPKRCKAAIWTETKRSPNMQQQAKSRPLQLT